jgi:hypothetical protein
MMNLNQDSRSPRRYMNQECDEYNAEVLTTTQRSSKLSVLIINMNSVLGTYYGLNYELNLQYISLYTQDY